MGFRFRFLRTHAKFNCIRNFFVWKNIRSKDSETEKNELLSQRKKYYTVIMM